MFAKNFTGTLPRWLPGTVIQVTGPVSYVIKLTNGQTVRRHVDAVRSREGDADSTPLPEPSPLAVPLSVPFTVQPQPVTPPPQPDADVPTAPLEENTATYDQITADPDEITLPPPSEAVTPEAAQPTNIGTPTNTSPAPHAVQHSTRPSNPVTYWRGSGFKRGRV